MGGDKIDRHGECIPCILSLVSLISLAVHPGIGCRLSVTLWVCDYVRWMDINNNCRRGNEAQVICGGRWEYMENMRLEEAPLPSGKPQLAMSVCAAHGRERNLQTRPGT